MSIGHPFLFSQFSLFHFYYILVFSNILPNYLAIIVNLCYNILIALAISKKVAKYKKGELLMKSFFNEELPPPLSDKELKKLTESDFSQEDRKLLIEHNLRLVIYIAKKFTNTEFPMDELIASGNLGLVKAAQTFDPKKKIMFSTYAARCIKNEMLMCLRYDQKWKQLSYFEDALSVDNEGHTLTLSDVCQDEKAQVLFESCEDRTLLSKILTFVLNHLSSREQLIFLYHLAEKSQRDIEKILGISQSYISRIEKQIRTELLSTIFPEIQGNEPFILLVEDNSYSLKILSDFNYRIIKFDLCKESFISIAEICCNQ